MKRARPSPPRARLAFRVGVVGHRPNRLPGDPKILAALRAQIALVLATAKRAVEDFQAKSPDKTLYTDEPALLRAISPLAEGSDRIFADEAIAQGYALGCPLPFALAEFEADFARGKALERGSLARFRGLLARARNGAGLDIFELDGDRATEGAAYGACGHVVLNQSDLLVIVWDGREKAGDGGTVDTLREAIRYHVPVLWIDALEPASWTLVRADDDVSFLSGPGRRTPGHRFEDDPARIQETLDQAVEAIVLEEIGLPRRDTDTARAHARTYFSEHRPPLNLFFLWGVFRELVGWRPGGKVNLPAVVTRDFVDSELAAAWPQSPNEGTLTFAPRSKADPLPAPYWVNGQLRDHFAWSDGLADLYADAHRSAYILSYLLAAVAVLVALIPVAFSELAGGKSAETIYITAEVLTAVAILGLLLGGRFRRWHERWMEYRLLAELIRQLKFLIPLGGGRPLPRTPLHLAGHGDPGQSWMAWQMRALARAAGLPSRRVNSLYVDDCLVDLANVAGCEDRGQGYFYRTSFARDERIHERLQRASLTLFVLMMVGTSLHLALHVAGQEGFDLGPWIGLANSWLVLSSAFLPALGAAIAGINTNGEFGRLAKRSRAMANGFERFAREFARLRARMKNQRRVSLSEVIPVANSMAETMVSEVIDWRSVILDRPQTA